MKRSVLAIALAASACGPAASSPQAGATAPGFIEIANFKGTVDPAIGSMTIETVPTAAGRAMGATSLVLTGPGGATVANDPAGSMWLNEEGHCNGPGASAGRLIKVTLGTDYPDTGNTFVTGVFAQITSLVGTGSESCNSATVPPGLPDSGLGLWYYPYALAKGARSGSTPWAFKWNGGAAFTFTGRVVAQLLNIYSFPAAGTQPYIDGSLDPQTTIIHNGSSTVYANQASGLTFVDADGTATTQSTLPANATSLAFSPSIGKIWFTTSTRVGCASSTGVAVDSVAWTGGGSPSAIVADPGDGTRAWFVDKAAQKVGSATCVGGTAALSTVFTPGGPLDASRVPYFLSVGVESPNRLLYITNPSAGLIYVHDTSGALIKTWTWPGGAAKCGSLMHVITAPNGNLWLTSSANGEVCEMTPGLSGTVDYVGKVAAPESTGPMTLDASGNIWAVWGTNQVVRIVPATRYFTGYSLAPNAYSTVTSSLVSGGGAVWATSTDATPDYPGSGVRRLTLPTWP